MTGTLVDVEGIDGSGKGTQVERLVERARSQGLSVAQFAFPRYETPIGQEIRRYLNGDHGPLDVVDPKFASILYMVDRHQAKGDLANAICDHDLVIADRYAPSNSAHQGALFERGTARTAMLQWLREMEYDVMGNVQPHAVVYLDIPPRFAARSMDCRGSGKDIHERDPAHQDRVREVYQDLACGQGWISIDCLEAPDVRLSVDEVTDKIWKGLQASEFIHNIN